jgi:RNA polymerase sigma factor (TIGR02999 family)
LLKSPRRERRACEAHQVTNPNPEISTLLASWRSGDQSALDRLLPIIYDELHRIASRQRRGERDDHTLDTTALLHEAYLRLVGTNVEWVDRQHFFAVAARTMRRVLVDHARSHGRAKRSGGAVKVSLDHQQLAAEARPADLIDLDEAMQRLSALDERKGRVVELHYFGGLSYDEIAAVTEVSPATVHRELRMARAWLARELGAEPDDP